MAEQERIQKTRQQEVVNAEEAIRVDASRHDQLKNDLDELFLGAKCLVERRLGCASFHDNSIYADRIDPEPAEEPRSCQDKPVTRGHLRHSGFRQ
jgi:hypothetical protein